MVGVVPEFSPVWLLHDSSNNTGEMEDTPSMTIQKRLYRKIYRIDENGPVLFPLDP